jgi:hypothetical protein
LIVRNRRDFGSSTVELPPKHAKPFIAELEYINARADEGELSDAEAVAVTGHIGWQAMEYDAVNL